MLVGPPFLQWANQRVGAVHVARAIKIATAVAAQVVALRAHVPATISMRIVGDDGVLQRCLSAVSYAAAAICSIDAERRASRMVVDTRRVC